MSRLDLNAVLDWVPEGSTVLDLGCGDGAFLQRLRNERRVTGVGVDIDAENLVTAVSKGLDVIQEDINDGLHCFTTNRFDVVVLAHALQELTDPHIALQRMVDIGEEAIVSFPNFGHWACRFHLGFKGRMPMSKAMPRHWYDTPNIHFCTVEDFEALCSELQIDVIARATVSGFAQGLLGKYWPNLFATSAVYRICRARP
jgi:methionine biosynthesis protein MetW